MPASSAADETREILRPVRAILTDNHFVYISGDHGRPIVCRPATVTLGR